MTLATEYTDYRSLPVDVQNTFNRCSPNLLDVQAWILAEWPGTKPNGCWGPRPIRGGTEASIHSYAAIDVSYRGLATAAGKDIAETCRALSLELGLQAVHDYARSRIWRPNRDPKIYPDGWKIQPRDAYGMGWGDWVHLETYRSAWHNDTDVLSRLAGSTQSDTPRPSIGPGSRGDLVVAVQYFLLVHAGQQIVVDGDWGGQTSKAWSNFVVWTNAAHPGAISADGRVDGSDWNLIAWLSGGWDGLYSHGFPVGA